MRSQPGRVVSIVRLRRVFPAPTRRTSRSLVSPTPVVIANRPSSSFARFTLDHRSQGYGFSRLVDAAFEKLTAINGVFYNGVLSSIVDISGLEKLRSLLLFFFPFLRLDFFLPLAASSASFGSASFQINSIIDCGICCGLRSFVHILLFIRIVSHVILFMCK